MWNIALGHPRGSGTPAGYQPLIHPTKKNPKQFKDASELPFQSVKR